jgi:ABC-type dipeptide/oligopeptide/nickel transport system permease subunit
MAKCVTPEMIRINEKNEKRNRGRQRQYSFAADAWKRLKRNRLAVVGLIIIGILVVIALFVNFIAPYPQAAVNPSDAFQFPSKAHPFGTDQLGRDVLSRCLYATRVSLPMGIVSTILAVFFGGLFGLVAAYFMGKTDNVIMRVMDVLQSIPGMVMAICVVASLGTSTFALIIAIAVSTIPGFSRVVRAAALTVRDNEYIEASRTIGASNMRLMIYHILPNSVGHVIINVVGSIAINILIISGLSYIGLGIQAPTPEWGSLLSNGRQFIQSYPYLVMFPGLFIMITVFSFNLLGDGVRDALDPRLK